MKKLFYIPLLFIFLSGCEDDDNTSIDRSLLLGSWEKIEVELNNTCKDYLEFKADTYRTKEVCSSSSSWISFTNYEISGGNIIVSDKVLYEIVYLSPTLLKLTTADGQLEEYKKP